ncbi:uncharacterized protein LACBIDRAFT_321476 [Laccaria bicolor S238N-H82]|uniref:Predicted protein n=1 Tax=Laccaria bicolor (strain S238N-H82 / ATCC MYA-4686) TaxID=486041 RepID=B0CT13_LACBS|nr:uncharacterized protein LACBIDRAFT_321476 [Laccaria bicolor S238N-H82]EDR13858.1 predicted protein [Laccaria bicolor S238N-H82]|eukprot:XP_001874417.1 predicted protein [Laccaria bicolor S238N-H82]
MSSRLGLSKERSKAKYNFTASLNTMEPLAAPAKQVFRLGRDEAHQQRKLAVGKELPTCHPARQKLTFEEKVNSTFAVCLIRPVKWTLRTAPNVTQASRGANVGLSTSRSRQTRHCLTPRPRLTSFPQRLVFFPVLVRSPVTIQSPISDCNGDIIARSSQNPLYNLNLFDVKEDIGCLRKSWDLGIQCPTQTPRAPTHADSKPPISRDHAKMFDESKFFGYMTPELCTLLLDISEYGLAKPHPTETGIPVGPRFYMKYLSEVWFVLFVSGCRDGITGYSPEIPDIEDLDEDEDAYGEQEAEGIAREKVLAEDYDVKLCEEKIEFLSGPVLTRERIRATKRDLKDIYETVANLLTKTLKGIINIYHANTITNHTPPVCPNPTHPPSAARARITRNGVEDSELDKAKVNIAGVEDEFTAAESRGCVLSPTFLNLNFLSPHSAPRKGISPSAATASTSA